MKKLLYCMAVLPLALAATSGCVPAKTVSPSVKATVSEPKAVITAVAPVAAVPAVAAPQPASVAEAPAADPYAKPGFYTQMHKGRLWVFREGSKELEEFKAKGEPAKQLVRPKAGPDGVTLKGPDAETLDAYMAQ